MNKAAIVVINEESKNQIEVLNASKLFNRHRSQSFTSRSFFDASEEKQRINSLIRCWWVLQYCHRWPNLKFSIVLIIHYSNNLPDLNYIEYIIL